MLSGSKKCLFLGKFGVLGFLCFSCFLGFDIRPFALLPTTMTQQSFFLHSGTFLVVAVLFSLIGDDKNILCLVNLR